MRDSTILLSILLILSISTIDISRSYGQTEFLPAIMLGMIAAIPNDARALRNEKDRDFVFQKADEILKEKFPNASGIKYWYWQVEPNGFLRKFKIDSRFDANKLILMSDGYLLIKWNGMFEVVSYGFWKNHVVYKDEWKKWLK